MEEGDAISPGSAQVAFADLTEKQTTEKYKQYKRKITKELLDSWKEDAEKTGHGRLLRRGRKTI